MTTTIDQYTIDDALLALEAFDTKMRFAMEHLDASKTYNENELKIINAAMHPFVFTQNTKTSMENLVAAIFPFLQRIIGIILKVLGAIIASGVIIALLKGGGSSGGGGSTGGSATASKKDPKDLYTKKWIHAFMDLDAFIDLGEYSEDASIIDRHAHECFTKGFGLRVLKDYLKHTGDASHLNEYNEKTSDGSFYTNVYLPAFKSWYEISYRGHLICSGTGNKNKSAAVVYMQQMNNTSMVIKAITENAVPIGEMIREINPKALFAVAGPLSNAQRYLIEQQHDAFMKSRNSIDYNKCAEKCVEILEPLNRALAAFHIIPAYIASGIIGDPAKGDTTIPALLHTVHGLSAIEGCTLDVTLNGKEVPEIPSSMLEHNRAGQDMLNRVIQDADGTDKSGEFTSVLSKAFESDVRKDVDMDNITAIPIYYENISKTFATTANGIYEKYNIHNAPLVNLVVKVNYNKQHLCSVSIDGREDGLGIPSSYTAHYNKNGALSANMASVRKYRSRIVDLVGKNNGEYAHVVDKCNAGKAKLNGALNEMNHSIDEAKKLFNAIAEDGKTVDHAMKALAIVLETITKNIKDDLDAVQKLADWQDHDDHKPRRVMSVFVKHMAPLTTLMGKYTHMLSNINNEFSSLAAVVINELNSVK